MRLMTLANSRILLLINVFLTAVLFFYFFFVNFPSLLFHTFLLCCSTVNDDDGYVDLIAYVSVKFALKIDDKTADKPEGERARIQQNRNVCTC